MMSFTLFPSKKAEDANTSQTAAQMPNVFVVPPEEDQTPPWCFFDAENPAFSQVVERPETPEITVHGLPYNDDTPKYRRSSDPVVPAPKGVETVSVVQALLHGDADEDEDEDEDEEDSDSESEQDMGLADNNRVTHDSHRQQSATTFRDVADDSDVIEVVRLSRKDYSEDPEEISSIQAASERKTTLKYRASKVFRSLRGTLRSSKPPVQDVFKFPPSVSSSQSTDTHSRARTPTMSRRSTLILSQLFTSPSLKSRNSMASFDESIPSPTEPSLPPSFPPQSKPVTETISRRSSLYAAEAQDEARLHAASPTPTTTSTKSRIRRFSMMSLQRLFSFSSSAPPSTEEEASLPFDDSGRAIPTPRSNAPTPPSAASSVITTSGPQTPTSSEGIPSAYILSTQDPSDIPTFMGFDSAFDANVGLNLGLGLGLDMDSGSHSPQATPRKKFPSDSRWRLSRKARPTSQHSHDEDPSLEMRLDSFHFDDLSFDADEFKAT